MEILTDGSYRGKRHGMIAVFSGREVYRKKTRCSSSTEAELKSIKYALEILLNSSIVNAVIINDNKPIVDHLNGNAKIGSNLKPISDECLSLMRITNTQVEWRPRRETIIPDIACSHKEMENVNFKTLSLPELKGLNPTVLSTLMKLVEEMGELFRVYGKMQGLSGEKPLPQKEVKQEFALELLDVAQTCITMMFVLEKEIDVQETLQLHLEKLLRKGYLKKGSKEECLPQTEGGKI